MTFIVQIFLKNNRSPVKISYSLCFSSSPFPLGGGGEMCQDNQQFSAAVIFFFRLGVKKKKKRKTSKGSMNMQLHYKTFCTNELNE